MEQKEQEKLCETYWDIWESCQTDPEYARLLAELKELEPLYEGILGSLSRDCREVLDDYLTLREHMNRRMLEYACQNRGSHALPFGEGGSKGAG